jgi:hypothetical protein
MSTNNFISRMGIAISLVAMVACSSSDEIQEKVVEVFSCENTIINSNQ